MAGWGGVQIADYFFDLAVEAADLGILLGYALAVTPAFGSWEDWLNRAIAAAGLSDYKPSTEYRGPLPGS
jgi:hypothetical protein